MIISEELLGMVSLHYNERTYGSAYLISFNVGPLRASERARTHTLTLTHTHSLGPPIIPLLEATTERFFWNLPEFDLCIRADVLQGCERCPLVAHFHNREQLKVTWSEILAVLRVYGERIVFLGAELLHNK
jgi:hypothetical protein